MLILRTGLHREVHQVGKRQTGKKKPYYKKPPADHEENRPSIIRLHAVTLYSATTNVNLLDLRQTDVLPESWTIHNVIPRFLRGWLFRFWVTLAQCIVHSGSWE